MPSGAKLEGKDAMKQKIQRYMGSLPKDEAAALYQEGQIELAEIVDRTPIRFGFLRQSEHIDGPDIQEGPMPKVSITFVAGGPAAPYAIFVHEDPDALHPRGGQWKYMESVLIESAPHLGARIAARIRANRAV